MFSGYHGLSDHQKTEHIYMHIEASFLETSKERIANEKHSTTQAVLSMKILSENDQRGNEAWFEIWHQQSQRIICCVKISFQSYSYRLIKHSLHNQWLIIVLAAYRCQIDRVHQRTKGSKNKRNRLVKHSLKISWLIISRTNIGVK